MKTIESFLFLIVASCLLFCTSCEEQSVPVITTTAITSVTTTSANSGGNITDEGNSTVIARGVCWSTGTTPTIGDSITSDGAGAGSFQSKIADLLGGTTYFVRAYATNDKGTGYGMALSFKTLGDPPSAPIAIIGIATNLEPYSATLNGTVNAKFNSTTVIFEYGTTTSYGGTITATQSPVTGSTNAAVNVSITGLTEGTTYHFRIKATNSLGTTFSDDMAFTTLGNGPMATTLTATNTTTTTAQLNGTVNANYLSSVVTFDYGTTTGYGSSVPASPSPVTGGANTNVIAGISGLTAGTTYHYRIKAVNSLGTTYGSDMEFKTNGQVPTALILEATNITTVAAQLNGTVNANYLLSVVTFEYGTTAGYGTSATAVQSPVSGSTNTNVSVTITGLAAGTTYHFRVKAENALGTTYGSDMMFKTLGAVPSVSTQAASNIDITGATLNGLVNANYLTTNVEFEYGTNTNYGIVVTPSQSPVSGSTNTSVVFNLSGLSVGTTYHFRVKAENALGATYGNDMTFKTLGAVPTASTQPATMCTNYSSATLFGTVNANYLSTSVSFDYGTTSSYGSNILATPNTVNGATDTPVNAALTGLAPETTYYFRVKAENALGTTYGEQLTFTTIKESQIYDIDCNLYNTVTIGTQTWMVENLRTTRYSNGDIIENSVVFIPDSLATHGRIYTIAAALDKRNACPTNYHVPRLVEWETLINYVGGASVAGLKLKVNWFNGTNDFGFTALPSGYSYGYALFNNKGLWWTNDSYSTPSVSWSSDGVDILMDYELRGATIRCVKD